MAQKGLSDQRFDDGFFGQTVLGIDEAGRGPLAGPVVAAGVILNVSEPIPGLNDSKKLSKKAREDLFHQITKRALFVSIKAIDAETIDKLNILQATLLAMKEVIISCARVKFDLALIDGNRTVPNLPSVRQVAIVSGDSRIQSIMAASIVAKVHRDRLMMDQHCEYPAYGFDRHKGYGTKAHLDALERVGPCFIHRRSFAPIKDMVR